MSFRIRVKSEREKQIRVSLKGRPYMDNVVEMSPLQIDPGDTLEVSVNVSIVLEIDGVEHDVYNDEFSYTFDDFKQPLTVRFIRFTKYKDDARIDCFESFPPIHTLYRPVWNAEKLS